MPGSDSGAGGGGPVIVTVNGGSSSIKFAVFSSAAEPKRLFGGQVDRINTPNARLKVSGSGSSAAAEKPVSPPTFEGGVRSILGLLHQRLGDSVVSAIGHRIVHGGSRLLEHQRLTPEVLAELRQVQEIDLAHLPTEIELIEAFQQAFPGTTEFVCFDTAFHKNLPRLAQLLPIPRRYLEAGVRRFGFHGLSYTYLMGRLAELAGPEAAAGRVILAHLGSGASMAAVHGGKPVDTTMAFTPTAGLMMGTRPGDLDPGLLVYLIRDQQLTPDDADKFISQKCGLLGVSDTSSDIQTLLAARTADPRAADAVELFCYQARKQLCGMAAALGGVDTVVFAGGIGEHSAEIRAELCTGLEFLGVAIDRAANANSGDVISADGSRVTVRVIATDEEVVIARSVWSLMRGSSS